MPRPQPIWIVCGLLLVLSCGRATVRTVRTIDLEVSGVSFDATSVTVLARGSSCATAFEKIVVTGDDATRACVRGLAEGAKVQLVQRRMHFKLMTCGAKPEVADTLGPCTIPSGAMQTESSGQACATASP